MVELRKPTKGRAALLLALSAAGAIVSATQLQVMLSTTDVGSGGTHALTVVTPAPGGGTSNAATLTVVGPTMTLDRTTVPLGGTVVLTLTNGPGENGEYLESIL